jgi:hypothetical protein
VKFAAAHNASASAMVAMRAGITETMSHVGSMHDIGESGIRPDQALRTGTDHKGRDGQQAPFDSGVAVYRL